MREIEYSNRICRQCIALGFLLFCCLSPFQAQNFTNNWYFGINAGIGFNGDSVAVFSDGQTNATEGTASYSDSCGRLVCYSDGATVWNANHLVMLNGSGLKGHHSSSQSSLFIPMPGSEKTIYLFTVDLQGGSEGLNYSVIDLSLGNGLGGIAQKNIPLITPICEKITAVNHQNGRDVWISVHEYGSDAFYTYLLNDSGLNPNPVISHVGDSIKVSQFGTSALGTMKFSPQGDRLAMGSGYAAELFDFDNTSGIVSNALELEKNTIYAYGIEFSPNGRFLYLCGFGIYQYDLLASDVKASRVRVDYSAGFYALQLGPDRKIYSAQSGTSSLNSIQFPNKKGIACQVNRGSIGLQGNLSKIGLPNFNQSYFAPDIWMKSSCADDSIYFHAAGIEYDSLRWYFNDPLSANDSTSISDPVKHKFNSPGNYRIRLETYLNGISTSYSKSIVIPKLELANDTLLCVGERLILDPKVSANLVWNTGETSSKIEVTSSGWYWVESDFEGCCLIRDSIRVDFQVKPQFSIQADPYICPKDTQELSIDNRNQSSVLWSTEENTNQILVNLPGFYSVTLDDGVCAHTESIELKSDPTLCPIEISIPNIFTPNGDGVNDFFKAKTQVGIQSLIIFIFNRSGILVHKSNKTEIHWDGKDLDWNKVPSGNYYYLVQFIDVNQKKQVYKGWLTLLSE